NKPRLAGGIPMESSAELVVDSAALHSAQGVQRYFKGLALTPTGIVSEQKAEGHRPRKFWRSTETAVRGVVGRGDLFVCVVKNGWLNFARSDRLLANNLDELLCGAASGLSN